MHSNTHQGMHYMPNSGRGTL